MNKIIKRDLIILTVLIIYLIITINLQINCPIRKITGIPCPACGSSRAIISLLHFNIKDYFYYNALTLPLLIAVIIGLHTDILKVDKKYIDLAIIVIAIVTFLYYLYRMYFSLIP